MKDKNNKKIEDILLKKQQQPKNRRRETLVAYTRIYQSARWPKQPTQINLAKKNGVTMAYWFDGPLAVGLADKLGRQEMLAFAQAARQSMTLESADRKSTRLNSSH